MEWITQHIFNWTLHKLIKWRHSGGSSQIPLPSVLWEMR